MTIIKPIPFKVGDKLTVNAEVLESHGYTSALPQCHGRDYIGMTGEVLAIDYYEIETAYPDAQLRFPNGKTEWIDICYLSTPVATPVVKTAGAAKKVSPQCKMILAHLKAGNTITHRSALMDFGVMALPRRIADLKDHHGVNITSTMEYNKLTGQRYARYSLAAA